MPEPFSNTLDGDGLGGGGAAATPVLVTGAAGFIGYHVAERLLQVGRPVVGVDNLSDYYSVRLKEARLERLARHPHFRFVHADLADRAACDALFGLGPFPHVVHLAAQAGVRHSIENPHAYIDSNVVGFVNVLEACRQSGCEHFVFASSSSVYGARRDPPFHEEQAVGHPVSLYAATKRADELMAHSYAHLFRLPVTGLRFFTVYGPWGRPDMAYFLFAEAISAGRPIRLFNEGKMRRDFTYVDDVVEGVTRLLDRPPAPDPAWDPVNPAASTSSAPYRILNVGGDAPTELLSFVETLERVMGQTAEKRLEPMQPGDVLETHASAERLRHAVGFQPTTSLEEGLGRFAEWFRTDWPHVRADSNLTASLS